AAFSISTATPDGPVALPLLVFLFCSPLTYIFNLSLHSGTVPLQWKKAIINPIPKIPHPSTCSDFRPISLTPILSRIFEKLLVKSSLYPLFMQPSVAPLFQISLLLDLLVQPNLQLSPYSIM